MDINSNWDGAVVLTVKCGAASVRRVSKYIVSLGKNEGMICEEYRMDYEMIGSDQAKLKFPVEHILWDISEHKAVPLNDLVQIACEEFKENIICEMYMKAEYTGLAPKRQRMCSYNTGSNFDEDGLNQLSQDYAQMSVSGDFQNDDNSNSSRRSLPNPSLLYARLKAENFAHNREAVPQYLLRRLDITKVVEINRRPLTPEYRSTYPDVKSVVEEDFCKIAKPSCFYSQKLCGQIDVQFVLANVTFKEWTKVEAKDNEDAHGQAEYKEKTLKFVKRWTSDPDIKSYTSYAFIPPPLQNTRPASQEEEQTASVLNTFDVDKYQTLLTMHEPVNAEDLWNDPLLKVLQHFLLIVICNSCHVKLYFFACLIYHILYFPGINPEIFLIIFSEAEGTGKNTLGYLIKSLMQNLYWHEQSCASYLSKGAGGFTGDVSHIVKVISECNGVTKKEQNTIKANVTQITKPVNIKNEKTTIEGNYERIFCMANTLLALFGRRFYHMEVNPIMAGNRKYFNKVYAAMAQKDILWAFCVVMTEMITVEDKTQMEQNKFSFRDLYEKIPNNIASEAAAFAQAQMPLKFAIFLFLTVFDINGGDELMAKASEMSKNVVRIDRKEIYKLFRSFENQHGKKNKTKSTTEWGSYPAMFGALQSFSVGNGIFVDNQRVASGPRYWWFDFNTFALYLSKEKGALFETCMRQKQHYELCISKDAAKVRLFSRQKCQELFSRTQLSTDLP